MEFNWEYIWKKYPKAFEQFADNLFGTSTKEYRKEARMDYPNRYLIPDLMAYRFDEEYDHLKLFDFFEKRNIYVSVFPEFYTDGVNFNWQLLWYNKENEWIPYESENTISYKNLTSETMWYGDDGDFPSFKKAALSAFEKAFGILEERLSTLT